MIPRGVLLAHHINMDENEGYRLEKVGGSYILKENVMVDDDYAYYNPVWIVDFHEFLDEGDINHRKYLGLDQESSNVVSR